MIDKIYKNGIKLNSVFFQKNDSNKDNCQLIDNSVFPLKIDNRQRLSPVDNQGNAPACVCYATCSIAESIFWKRNGYPINFDALELYNKCKKKDGCPNADGTTLEVGLYCAKDAGLFGKNDGRIIIIRNNGKDEVIDKVKNAIFKYDFILGGFCISEGMYDLVDGRYMVTGNGKKIGGHCMTICGWNKTGIIVQNQWGTSFGAKGFCIYPYDVFMKEFIYGAYLTNTLNDLN